MYDKNYFMYDKNSALFVKNGDKLAVFGYFDPKNGKNGIIVIQKIVKIILQKYLIKNKF